MTFLHQDPGRLPEITGNSENTAQTPVVLSWRHVWNGEMSVLFFLLLALQYTEKGINFQSSLTVLGLVFKRLLVSSYWMLFAYRPAI